MAQSYEAPETMSMRQKQSLLFVTLAVIVIVIVLTQTQSGDAKTYNGQNKVLGSSWWWWGGSETTAPQGTKGPLKSYWDRIWGTPTPTTDKPMPTEAPDGYQGSPHDWWHEYGRDQGYQRPYGHTQSAWQKQVTTQPRNYYENDDHKRRYENVQGQGISTLPIILVLVLVIGMAVLFMRSKQGRPTLRRMEGSMHLV